MQMLAGVHASTDKFTLEGTAESEQSMSVTVSANVAPTQMAMDDIVRQI